MCGHLVRQLEEWRRPSKKQAIVKKLLETIPDVPHISFKGRRKSLEKVFQFYNRDNISYQEPGKRDCKSVKDRVTGKQELKQKCHMTNQNSMYLDNLMCFLHMKCPITCVCKYHANFNFIVAALQKNINSFPADASELFNKLCCDTNSEKCLTDLWCRCVIEVHSLLSSDCDYEKQITWRQWQEVESRTKLVIT